MACDLLPESLNDFEEFALPLTLEEQCEQASRCMNCGVAFCQTGVALGDSLHAVGCPLHNLIPETNDLLYQHRFEDAVARVALTNPFPEFTGRVCPAPCEVACNLGLHKAPVTINDNERALSNIAWENGIDPLPAPAADAPLVSVIGSGPAGLACAWEMARRGWRVRIYEQAGRPGGLLMYGIPNMKLPKWIIERRVNLMRESGIDFNCGVDACACADAIAAESDAVVIATGANVARDVALPGRELSGIHFALEYLSEVASAYLDERDCSISAEGKDVVVIGGGDTGNDCVACALRQGAASVTQVIRAQRAPERPAMLKQYGPARTRSLLARLRPAGSERALRRRPASSRPIRSPSVVAKAPKRARLPTCTYRILRTDGGRHLVEGTEAARPCAARADREGLQPVRILPSSKPSMFRCPSAVVHTACAKPTQRTTSLPSSLRAMHALVRRSW